jgi:hypothetical protein
MSGHTPGRVINFDRISRQYECGCTGENGEVRLCAKHAAAPDLLEALKFYMAGHHCEGKGQCPSLLKAEVAIAKAEGR